MSWSHRSLEGALYGLAGRPDARPAAARPAAVPMARRPPDTMPRGITRRLDVDIALRHTLTDHERRIVYEHYVTGRQHPYRERKRIIGALLVALNAEVLDGTGD